MNGLSGLNFWERKAARPGCYVFDIGGRCVYVGKSAGDMGGRVSEHVRRAADEWGEGTAEEIRGERASIVFFPTAFPDVLEVALIARYRPSLNREYVNTPTRTPRKLSRRTFEALRRRGLETERSG